MSWLSLGVLSVVAVSSVLSAKLVWEENFNGNSLDKTKWNVEVGYLNVNAEQENYQKPNVQVEGGNLVITAKKQTIGGQKYTSGRINTQNKFSFQYGRAEARIKLPLGQGLWPAFWMLGNSIGQVGWPKCGEIDIMEHINTESKVFGTLHWFTNSPTYQGHAEYGTKTDVANMGDWHVYATEWNAKEVKIFVDGKQYYVIDISKKPEFDMFHQPFYLIVNLAVGGQLPGQNIDESKLPAKMLVDWIKVYSDGGNKSG
ncbi:hypothetical protein AAVH_08073 [Aphelenchoides avenae]|nr:hypothetical protein AAVH_08073 [Aphelenchus avenae]